MKVHKIMFEMKSPIIYNTLPILDSIVSYCSYEQDYRKHCDFKTCTGVELSEGMEELRRELPLEINDAYRFFLTSYMCNDGLIKDSQKWRKRWEDRFDFYVSFGKGKKRIHKGSGQFKSYDVPMCTNSVKQAWFYFCGDAEEVLRLIRDNLFGIGKKTDVGFGSFKYVDVEETSQEERKMVFYRPLPIEMQNKALKLFGKVRPSFGSYKLPYWLPEHQRGDIIIPVLEKQVVA